MDKPKVLIQVSGGVAYYAVMGDVDVELVDEDNIDGGDPPVEFDETWKPLLKGRFNLPFSRYVYIVDTYKS